VNIVEYQSISKGYDLGDGKLIGVDQSNNSEDRTCLCVAKFEDGVMDIKEIKYIEKQENMEKYINRNLAKIHGAFGISNLD
jgi:hypothetical protein